MPTDETKTANFNWSKYEYARDRNHVDYIQTAKETERFYLGGGLQWKEEDKQLLESERRPWIEVNAVKRLVDAVIGYYSQNREEIQYRGKSPEYDSTAVIASKLLKHILDNEQYRWKEKAIVADGFIQQRGFLEFYVETDDNALGEIRIRELDNLDVIPDPDANSYDPTKWKDVIITRWYSLEDIEEIYGRSKANEVMQYNHTEDNFGWDDSGEARNSFGNQGPTSNDRRLYDAYYLDDKKQVRSTRIIDRQYYKYVETKFFIDPVTGDMRQVPDGWSAAKIKRFINKFGLSVINTFTKRVRWTVSTRDVVLFDDWSPYRTFTVIPYFPYFRRGVTRGLVDNLIKPQELLNKTVSQALHIINSTANSGWKVFKGSLQNMNTEDLETEGSKTGLVIEWQGESYQEPKKIEPNQIPTGIERIIERADEFITSISPVNEAMLGEKSNEVSGEAVIARQQGSSIQLAGPMENLERTRYFVARKALELIQDYYTEERVIHMVNDKAGAPGYDTVVINQETPSGDIVNDMTLGEYSIVVATVPASSTFENSQFQEIVQLIKFGMPIPPEYVVKYSNLADRSELMEILRNAQDPEKAQIEKEIIKTQLEQLKAEVTKVKADTINRQSQSVRTAVDAAERTVTVPQIGIVADEVLKASGFNNLESNPDLQEENMEEEVPNG